MPTLKSPLNSAQKEATSFSHARCPPSIHLGWPRTVDQAMDNCEVGDASRAGACLRCEQWGDGMGRDDGGDIVHCATHPHTRTNVERFALHVHPDNRARGKEIRHGEPQVSGTTAKVHNHVAPSAACQQHM